jgi:hypothetical protein
MHADLKFRPVGMAVFTARSGRLFQRSSEDLSTAGQGDHPELLHYRVKIRDTEKLEDLAVADTHCVDCLESHPSACTRHAHKRADVGFEGLSGNRMLDQSITGCDP